MRPPRPVSPLSYEPVQPTSSDIVYESDTSAEDDSEQRHAKRRRIEEYGARYLQGYPLVLMTTRFRGPLQGVYKNNVIRWQNPWKTTTKASNDTSEANHLKNSQDAVPETAWRDAHDREPRHRDRLQGHHRRRNNSDTAFTAVEASNEKTWLRKDRDFSTSDNEASQRSPTPAKKMREPLMNTPRLTSELRNINNARQNASELPTSNQLPAGHGVREVRANIASHNFTQHNGEAGPDTSAVSALQTGYQRTERTHQRPVLGVELHYPEDLNVDTKYPEITDETKAGPVVQQRQLTKARKARRMDFTSPLVASRPVPSDKEPQSILDVTDESTRLENADAAISGPPILGSAVSGSDGVNRSVGEAILENTTSLFGPELATVGSLPAHATYRESTGVAAEQGIENEARENGVGVSAVPSAQLDPQPIIPLPHTSTASIVTILDVPPPLPPPSNAEMQLEAETTMADDSILLLSTQAAVCRAQQNLKNDLITTATTAYNVSNKDRFGKMDESRREDGIKLFKTMETPSPQQADIVNTQAMLEAISPFPLSTVKKPGVTRTNGITSTTVSKIKNKKRASFAPVSQESTSSSGSIKSSLRVTKMVSLSATAKETSAGKDQKSTLYREQPGSEVVLNNLKTSKQNDANLVETTNIIDRSEQSQPLVSSTAPFTLSNNTAQPSKIHQDAQVFHGTEVSGDDKEAGFDLSAAIDDMGSFLQSWDPEKEMRAIGKSSASTGQRLRA